MEDEMINWLKEFEEKFGKYEEIQKMGDKEFFGSLQINFAGGKVQNYNLTTHRRAAETQTKGA